MFVVFIALGFVLTFFGRSLFKPVLMISGIVLTIAFVWLLFYSTFLKNESRSWVGWVVVASSLIAGIGVGYLFMRFVKIGAFALGTWGGFSLALLLYNACLYYWNSQVGFWILCGGFALTCGVLSIFYFDHILIIASAIAGSYLFI